MVRVNGKIVDTSGGHNGLCLYNAVFAGMPEEERQKRGITSGEDLYHKSEAHRLTHPEYAQQADRYYQTMLYRDPDALMRGAGVWADATTGLQGVENWLDVHPALLSLMKNTGSVVGGAIWLSKLTPAGLVTGLVVNYGYEKLLKLMEGNIEVAKEHLTTYFQAHDEDITPEQASYLANCAMKVLQTAGQIAVHQAAAKGFNKVSRGGQLGRSGSTKKQQSKQGEQPTEKQARGAARAVQQGVNKSSCLQSWKVSTWNIGEGAVNKPHHNWHKIFGNQKPNLKQIEPYIKEALRRGEWKEIGRIRTRGNKEIITGTKVELVCQVENNKIWVLGMITADGVLIINNAGVE
jgi:hypothetical protein